MATVERRWYSSWDDNWRRATGRLSETWIKQWRRKRGTELIVAGDLNVDLGEEGNRGRYAEITVAVATAGMEDLAEHFLLRLRADVGNEAAGEISEVPDGLHYGVRPSDIPERGCPAPKAQLQLFLWSWGTCVEPPRKNTIVTLGAGHAYRYVRPAVRKGRGRTSYLLSCGAPS